MEFKKGNKVTIVNTGDIWEGKTGTVLYQEDHDVEVRINFETEEGEIKSVIQIFNEENLQMERENESLNEEKEELTESIELTEAKDDKVEDIIHRYVYLEDLDGNEVLAWNFAARIATAEDMDEGCICMKAEELGYKLFAIEAPGFYRSIIAAKGVKAEDIQKEYADFLQGTATVFEIK